MKKIIWSVLIVMAVMAMNEAESMAEQVLFINESVESDMIGLPTLTVKKSYYTKSRVYIDDSSQQMNTLIDFAAKKVYFIDHNQRHVTFMKMQKFIDMAKAVAARGVMGSFSEKDVTVTRGASRKTIRGYDCTELSALVGKAKIDIRYWICVPGKDIPIDNYYSFTRMLGADPALGKINREMSRDRVYPIEGTVRNVNGIMKVTCRELRVLGKGESMPGIPGGYEMTEMP